MIFTRKFPLLATILMVGLLVVVGATQAEASSFGVSPPFVNADKLVKGATYEQTIYLVRDVADSDLPISGALDIPDSVRSWVTVTPGLKFSIPQGVQQFPVKVTIKVPQDTELASYQGKLVFTGNPSQSGQVTIALGAQVAINITVGNDVYRKFDVRVVKVMDIEEGWSPRVYTKLDNQGNVPEEMTGATLEIFDQFGATRLAFSQSPKNLPKTPPFTVGENVTEFPIDLHLGLGQYWGVVNFYQNDQLITSQKTVFNVLKAGSLQKPSFAALFFNSAGGYGPYIAVALILLVLIVFGVFRLRRK